MSIEQITLHCDSDDDENDYPRSERCREQYTVDVSFPEAARKYAAQDGWIRDDGYDICPCCAAPQAGAENRKTPRSTPGGSHA